MASSNFLAPATPVFSGENYQIWVVKMKSYLRALGLWNVVETGREPAPLGANPTVAQMKHHEEEMAKKDKALTCIYSALSNEIFTTIMDCETAKQAWDKLKEEFEGSERVKAVKLLNLKRQFEMLKMKDGDSVRGYSSKLMEVVNQVRLYGEPFEDYKVVEKILISLPDRFESKVSAIEESCDLKRLTIAELLSKLQAQEQRKNMRSEDVTEGAFQANHRGKQFAKNVKNNSNGKFNKGKGAYNSTESTKREKFPPCASCKRTNHLEKDCWFKGKPPIQCSFCKKLGHIEKNCRAKQKQAQQQQAHYADEEPQSEDHLFMAFDGDHIAGKKTWFIDSGCTSHMTNDMSIFTHINKAVKVKVRMGNGAIVQSQGRGTIAVATKKGTKLIQDVLYVPSLDQNLLSVSQMVNKGYSFSFKDKCCVIFDQNDGEIARVEMVDKSFPLTWNSIVDHAYAAKLDETWLWHKRYGHVNLNSLSSMYVKGLTRDLPEIAVNEDVCRSCQLGKLHRQAFPSNKAQRAHEKLELVHTDVCGPMKNESLSHNKYFILFIDDLTRMTWVYFLSTKDEVFSAFKRFKTMAETQSGCKIKALRSDNGGEYTSTEFNQFCEEMGIEHQLTVSYTPEQNGVSERKNRTVVEMARCLLAEMKLPQSFWAEAVYTAIYLLNRLPTKSVSEKTPIEAWSRIKPSAKHLKIFGSICYVHVPSIKRSKFDEKAELGIFLGYASKAKGYRVYNLQTKKIMVSRDVKFDENAYWNWEKERVEKKDDTQQQPTSSHLGSSNSQVEGNESDSNSDDSSLDSPVLKSKSLAEIYERCNVVVFEPTTYDEASNYEVWNQAMQEEIAMIEKSATWELVQRPEDKNVIGVKWVYRTKLNPDGSVHKHKARLVVKGYAQLPGIDFGDTFAPVARHDTIRLLIAMAAKLGWKMFHLDVKSAFLNGVLNEEIYVDQPEGFYVANKEGYVYKLYKALYGLKQAPRAWYSKIDSHLVQHGFMRSDNEATLYVKQFEDGKQLIVSLYVDDLLVTGSDSLQVTQFKQEMEREFEMSDLGVMRYFLGLEIHQSNMGIFISQKKYATDILKKFKMEKCKSVPTPLVHNEKFSKFDGEEKVDSTHFRSLIGSLLYLTASRPDLMFPVSLLSRFMHSPSHVHLGAAKRILRYIKGTADYGVWYLKSESDELNGYSDSDWAGSLDDMKSTSGYVFSFGSGVFSWNSKKQDIVAQSSAEAEYVSTTAAANQAIWLRKMLNDLGMLQSQATVIFCDNKSAISIAKNPVQHGRTKHINIKFHAIREAVKNGEVQLVHCRSEEQLADILTKTLPKAKFEFLRAKLGVSKQNLKEE